MNLAHTEHRDDVGSKMGMWVFIFTEILFFGGLFIVYSVYRSMNPEHFHTGALELNTFIGTLNTVILLISSMTIAMSITALQKGDKKLSLALIGFTILVGLVFLVNKYFEWSGKAHHGLIPGTDHMKSLDHGHILFFSLYFFMTGLHALHIIVGVVLLTVVFVMVKKGTLNKDNFALLENGGLYWHLVDLIWIFLFPLFYLIT